MAMAHQALTRPAIDEEFRVKLRNDPCVIYHRQQTTEPFEPVIWLTARVDELWPAGRRDDEEVEPYLRGSDE
jgi:hypothetical protein